MDATMNLDAVATVDVAAMYRAAQAKRAAKEAAGCSDRTVRKYWRAVWRLEDELKSRGVF